MQLVERNDGVFNDYGVLQDCFKIMESNFQVKSILFSSSYAVKIDSDQVSIEKNFQFDSYEFFDVTNHRVNIRTIKSKESFFLVEVQLPFVPIEALKVDLELFLAPIQITPRGGFSLFSQKCFRVFNSEEFESILKEFSSKVTRASLLFMTYEG